MSLVAINYRDGRPIYEQVKDDLRRLVVSGILKPGDRLPSVRELAGQLAINPNTIQRAYRELEAEGYIISVPGRGSFAAAREDAPDPQRAELIEKLRETAKELQWLGMTAQEICAEIGGMRDEHD